MRLFKRYLIIIRILLFRIFRDLSFNFLIKVFIIFVFFANYVNKFNIFEFIIYK